MGMRTALAIMSATLAILLVDPSVVAAQESLAGRDAIAQAEAELLDKIPGVFVNSQPLGVIRPGERVLVHEQKDVVGVTRTDQWLFVTVHSSGQVGWVYNGIPGGPMYFEAAVGSE